MVCATAAVVWLLAVATAEANLIEKDPPSLQYDHGADKAANTGMSNQYLLIMLSHKSALNLRQGYGFRTTM